MLGFLPFKRCISDVVLLAMRIMIGIETPWIYSNPYLGRVAYWRCGFPPKKNGSICEIEPFWNQE
jgi:hypothetical protein